MASRKSPECLPVPAWRAAGLRYFSLDFFYRQRFGCKTWKISLDVGHSCPNVDGTIGTQGCIFCNLKASAPSRRLAQAGKSLLEQLKSGITTLQAKRKAEAFVAYFQPATNTHTQPERLAELLELVASQPSVVGISVGTRPDWVPESILEVLAQYTRKIWIELELGVQTIHDRSLSWLGRGHNWRTAQDAIRRAADRGLAVGCHLILGIPGETRADVLRTAQVLGGLPIHSVKIHHLHVLVDTPLAEMWHKGSIRLLERDEYIGLVADLLEVLPPHCVIERLMGDAPREFLLASEWSHEKSAVLRGIEAELKRRDSWQGSRWQNTPIET